MRRWIMIAIATLTFGILGTAGYVGYKNWWSRRIARNEDQIRAFMHQVASAQKEVQTNGVIDTDGNGAGEFGFLGELTGQHQIRQSDERLHLPALSRAGLTHVGQGIYRIHGYFVRVFLPGLDVEARWEMDPGRSGIPMPVDATFAEAHWWGLAWPVSYNWTGRRCFYFNRQGIMHCANRSTRYSGSDRIPPADVLLPAGPSATPPWRINAYNVEARGVHWAHIR